MLGEDPPQDRVLPAGDADELLGEGQRDLAGCGQHSGKLLDRGPGERHGQGGILAHRVRVGMKMAAGEWGE